MIPCPQCNKQNPENFNYCLDCGAELHPDTPHSAESQFFIDLSTNAEPSNTSERAAAALSTGTLRSLDGTEAPLELSPDDLIDDEEPLTPPKPVVLPIVETPVELEQPIMDVEEVLEERFELAQEPVPVHTPGPPLAVRTESMMIDIPLPEIDAEDPQPPIPPTEVPEIPLPDENWMENVPELEAPAPTPTLEPTPAPEPIPVLEGEPVLEPVAELEPMAAMEAAPELEPLPVLEPMTAAEPAPVLEPLPVLEPIPATEPAKTPEPPKEVAMPDIVRQVEDLEVDMTQIEERFCAACGAELTQDARFCPRCGANSSETRSPHAGKTLFLNVAAGATAAKATAVAHLTLLEANGSEGRRYNLPAAEQIIGREAADIILDDRSLSPLHAAFIWRDDKMFIEDRGSLNGVYLKVKGEVPLPSKSFIRIGQQLLRFVALEDFEQDEDCVSKDETRFMGSPVGSVWGKLLVITAQGRVRDALPLAKPQLLIGREQGELTFPQDGFVSGSHAKLSLRDNLVYLTDLGSSNGTYLRIEKQGLANNDLLLFGTKIMRFEYA